MSGPEIGNRENVETQSQSSTKNIRSSSSNQQQPAKCPEEILGKTIYPQLAKMVISYLSWQK